MSNVVIRAEGVGKRYLIGHQAEDRQHYTTLRDLMSRNIRNIGRSAGRMLLGQHVVAGDDLEEFWAIKNVSFDVSRGDVVGIIGRNGAGKSTLLKILSRITEPSEGRVEIRGRVASLLEVGTGFHPELSGRENIYLNGAILGMRSTEIKRKFNSIVEFAEISKFLDTPVKRYSSGMYVRLAFAVAAHLEPDILVIDEVLSVGDAEFQRKCLGKMQEVAGDGRTVLFVSHDLSRALQLCTRGILLQNGSMAMDSKIGDVLDRYSTGDSPSTAACDLSSRTDRSGSGEMRFDSISLTSGGRYTYEFDLHSTLELHLVINVAVYVGPINIAVTIKSTEGIPVYCFFNSDAGVIFDPRLGSNSVRLQIEELALYPGDYHIDLWIGDRNKHRIDLIHHAISFNVTQGSQSSVSRTLERANGLVYHSARWLNDAPGGKEC